MYTFCETLSFKADLNENKHPSIFTKYNFQRIPIPDQKHTAWFIKLSVIYEQTYYIKVKLVYKIGFLGRHE